MFTCWFALVFFTTLVTTSTGAIEIQATVGLSVTLQCNIGEVTTIAMWFSPGNILLTNDYASQTWDTRFQVQRKYQRERNLVISSVRLLDEGIYTCKQAGTMALLSEVMLVINVPPIVESSENVAVRVGGDVTISCRLTSGKPTPVIRWYFQGNGDEYVLPQVGESLVLTKVTRDQAGYYSCKANNGVPPEVKKTIRVDILFAPVSSLPNPELRQEYGSNAILMCIVDANPQGNVYWQRDRDGVRPATLPPQILPASAADAGDQQPASILSAVTAKFRFQTWPLSRDGYTRLVGAFIDKLDTPDFGTYTCYASNEYGSTEAKIAIKDSAVNGSETLPSTGASLGQSASSTSVIVLLVTLLVIVSVTAVGLGVMVVRLRRDVLVDKQPQLYRHCRT